MKKQKISFVFIATIALLASCRKKENVADNPLPHLGGRVVIVNSDTPVPNALVRFLKWAPRPGIFDPMTYIEISSDTTDILGHFDIPLNSEATMVIAFGPITLFNQESGQVELGAYFANGGEIKLQLIPPAWIKVSATDVEPFSSVIHHVEGHTNTGNNNGMTPLSSPQIWKVHGNTPQWLTYRYVYNDLSVGEIFNLDILPPTPYDTTVHVITY